MALPRKVCCADTVSSHCPSGPVSAAVSKSVRKDRSPRRAQRVLDLDSHKRHDLLDLPKDDKPSLSEPVAKIHGKRSLGASEAGKSRKTSSSHHHHERDKDKDKEAKTASDPSTITTLVSSAEVKEKTSLVFPEPSADSRKYRKQSLSTSTSTDSLSSSNQECVDPQNKCIAYYVRSLTSPFYLPVDQACTIAEFTQYVAQVFFYSLSSPSRPP
jgi:hypothetical protein